MPTKNVRITGHFEEFIAAEIEAGRYHDESEVLYAGLRLLEQQKHEDEQRLTRLKALAAEGFSQLDQGLGIRLNGVREITDFIERTGSGVRERAKVAENVAPNE
ncbi:MAG: type II toxin-antitoxin system ParD family antitoxin [Pirellulales bacterium]